MAIRNRGLKIGTFHPTLNPCFPSPIQTLTVGSGVTPDPPFNKNVTRVTD